MENSILDSIKFSLEINQPNKLKMQTNPNTVCFLFISLNFYFTGEEIAFSFGS